MTIPITGAGSFFVRIGHFGGGILDINALDAAAATARVLSGAKLTTRCLTTIPGDYANGTAVPQVITDLSSALAGYESTILSLPAAFQAYAQATSQVMYGIDVLNVPATAPLSQFQQAASVTTAIQGLIAQMTAAGTSLQAATVSAGSQTDVGTPTGNPIIVCSLRNGRGLILQLPFPETLTFTCVQDAQGGATAGQEALSITGQGPVSQPLSAFYPGSGSGVSVRVNAVNGAVSMSGGNMLNNSDFQTFTTSNYPDNWIVGTGAGTTVLNGTSSNAYTSGGGSLEFLGDGATLSSLKQIFGATPSTGVGSGGTSLTLVPNGVYHVNGWFKVSAAPSTGVARISLVNGSGTIIADDQGVNNTFNVALTGGTTSFANFNGVFRTPKLLPSAQALRIDLTTALENGKNAFFGRLGMAEADTSGNGIYAGGPFITVFSGNTNMLDGQTPDQWTMAISNSYQTSGSGLMQLLMDRLFGLRTMATPALQFPYAASSPTVADSLIA